MQARAIKGIVQVGRIGARRRARNVKLRFIPQIEMMNKARVETIRDFSISYSRSLNSTATVVDNIAVI